MIKMNMNFKSEVFNEDCMIGMSRYPDKHFDLAIVDPPYGININMNMGLQKGKAKKHKEKDWDNQTPDFFYFNELRRVSKNQVIWGGNYFIENLDSTPCFLIWDKLHGDGVDFADVEFAWTSFDSPAKRFKMRPMGMDGGRIHPTQKPIKLYRWILDKYGNGGGHILDTHLGSGSSRIAAYDLGFDFTAFELDKEYFDAQEKRFNNFKSQTKLF